MLDNLPYPHIIIPDMLMFLVALLAHGRSRVLFLGSVAALILVTAAWVILEPATVKYSSFIGVTFLTFAFAIEFGSKSEREAVVMAFTLMVIPYFAAIYQPGTNKAFDPIGAVVDAAYLVWLGTIAHRHDRFWAYFASACFALAVVGHLAVWMSSDFLPAAYLQMRFIPGGMLVFLLVLATAGNVRRTRRVRLTSQDTEKARRPLEA